MSSEVIVTEDQRVAHATVLDQVEKRLMEMGGTTRMRGLAIHGMPQTHTFTPGLYAREIRMPRGAVLTSKVHKTQHPFVVSSGAANVYNEAIGRWELIRAPHIGVTQPGTRRLLVIVQDMVWTTFHVTQTTDLEALEDELLEEDTNPILDSDLSLLRKEEA